MAQHQRTLVECGGCGYATLSYSTPAYHSLDEDRALTLVYSSGQSAPVGLVELDVNPNSTDLPSQISISLLRAGVTVPLISGAETFYAAGSGINRVTAAFDASTYSTGAYDMTAVVRSWWTSGTLETQIPVRVFVINERTSGFGSGWSVAGLQRLSLPNGLTGDATIVDGGTIVAFTNCGASCWTAPPGSSDTLVSVPASATIERRYRDGTVASFGASSGLLQQGSDRFGLVTSYTYDGSNRLSQVTDPAGLATTIVWTGVPGSTSTGTITTPGGRTTIIRTNSLGQLIDIKDPDNVVALATTYSADRITSVTDRIGSTTAFAYDRFSNLATATGPLIQTDDRGLAQSTVTHVSREASMLPGSGYGSATAPASRVWPDSVWLRTTTQRGDITRVRTNGDGEATLVQHIDALGKIDSTVISYNSNGYPATVVGTGGTRLAYEWNGDLLSRVTDNVSHTSTTFTYNGLGQPLTTSVNSILIEQNFYSTAVSRLDSTKTDSIVARYTSDAYGRTLSATDGEGHTMSFVYGTSGFKNLASATKSGHMTQFAYDSYGRQAGVTDAASRTASVTFDLVNRMTSATPPGLSASAWTYNDSTRQYTFTDAKSQTYQSVLNAAGAVTQTVDPRGLSDFYRYDSDGNPSSGTSRGARTVTTVRDVLGRPTQITAGALVTTIVYDTARKWTAYSNAEGVDTIFVDGANRVVGQVAVRNGETYQLRATFDSAGRRQTLNALSSAWGGIRTLHFGYDAIARQTFVEDFAGKGTSVAYNRDSKPRKITLPTNVTPSARLAQTYTYGSNDRLSSVVANLVPGVLNWYYSYDALDRATTLERGITGNAVRRMVDYDLPGRVSHWSDTEFTPGDPYTVCEDPTQIGGEGCTTIWPTIVTTPREESYTYDAVGNRTDLSASTQTGNRLVSFNGFTMTYDDDGNMLTKTGTGLSQSFTWNGLGQLASVTTNGTTTSFGYDGLGRRVRKTTSGVSTYFLYDGDNIVMQLGNTGLPQLEFSYYPGVDQPHAVRNSSTGAIYYYVTSQPNNATALVNSIGQVVNSYEYTPFGKSISATEAIAQPFRYAARQLDTETGLYYNRARYYDPAIARFISEDPIGLAGGVNQYAYVENDPVNMTDPTGLCVTFSDGKQVCLPPIVITAPYNDGPGGATNFGNQNARGRGNGSVSGGASSGSGLSAVRKAATEWFARPACNGSASNRFSNFVAGFGDFASLNATAQFRATYGYADSVDGCSAAYTAGEVTAGVTDLAIGGLVAARNYGWMTKIDIHEAHHTFGSLGRLSHLQLNWWRKGAKGSGAALRLPLPWR